MELSEKKPQLTSLMANETLARVERMRLHPNRRRTNRARGEHLSGKGGASIDFVDYRDYVAGDDIRNVDWNIFARLQRPYLKLYAHEEEMQVVVLLDCSSSMKHEQKFERARQLASAFAVMGLHGGERVSLYACYQAGASPIMLTGQQGRPSMRRVLAFLEGLQPGGDSAIEDSVDSVLRLHRGRGIAVVLSDFLTFGDVSRSFNLLHGAGLEIFGIQLLGPSEISPDLTGDLRFVDCETGLTLDVSSARELLGLYHEHRVALQEYLETQCRRRDGRFLSLSSEELLEPILNETLLRKGWIR
jgi:uncharacterized protein (DUF58 family)